MVVSKQAAACRRLRGFFSLCKRSAWSDNVSKGLSVNFPVSCCKGETYTGTVHHYYLEPTIHYTAVSRLHSSLPLHVSELKEAKDDWEGA